MLPRGSTLGILGGGQLGRMIAHQARALGYKVAVLDPTPDCPAAGAADIVVQGRWDDPVAIQELASHSDVVTVETEHIPAVHLESIEGDHVLRPKASVLGTIQDRKTQREFIDSIGLPQAAWRPVSTGEDAVAAAGELGVPAILKTRQGGYDGKGQVRLKEGTDPATAFGELDVPSIMEAFVPFDRELSILVARNPRGEHAVYPLAHNEHRDGILHITQSPTDCSPEMEAEARRIAEAVADGLDHIGLLCIELFAVGDKLLINEIAPRVHNSGHHTLGASVTSQFEQHVRAVCDLPLGSTDSLRPAAMLNILGEAWNDGEPDWAEVLGTPGVALHLYGKHEARPGRKMGHVLVLDDDAQRAHATAEALHATITRA